MCDRFGGHHENVIAGRVYSVGIAADGALLEGELAIPTKTRGVVVFAHGSGSSRHSPRNRSVAYVLNQVGLATLLFDLLTRDEETVDMRTTEFRFDIQFLARRLVQATDWLVQRPQLDELKVGYLAGAALPRVQAPTLLIVGGDDAPVMRMSREAMDQLRCEKRLEVVPGATHLFEEPGALEQVARVAREWFELYVGNCSDESQAA